MVWSCRLKGCFAFASAVTGAGKRTFGFFWLVLGYAKLTRLNKAKTAVLSCHCSGDMAVRRRKVLAMPRSCVVQFNFFPVSATRRSTLRALNSAFCRIKQLGVLLFPLNGPFIHRKVIPSILLTSPFGSLVPVNTSYVERKVSKQVTLFHQCSPFSYEADIHRGPGLGANWFFFTDIWKDHDAKSSC